LNEEEHLPYALRSVVAWVDEIIVVDMESEDRTVEIATAHGARVLHHPRTGYVEPARGFAIEQATGDWIMVLDADEVVPPRLARLLRQIAEEDQVDVVSIPWLNYLLGRPIMHAGWGPEQDRHRRFFRRGFFQSSAEIHAYGSFDASSRVLRLPYAEGIAVAHFNYTDVHHFIEKLNRYTDAEAERSEGANSSNYRAARRAGSEFVRRYLKQQGWRDGWRGFYLSALMATYHLVAAAKVRERREYETPSMVEAKYRSEAERWLQCD
jgi:glycosyltransferase involved in cell wall biosynthesis